MLSSQEIKHTFLNFFKSKGHTIVPSAPIVVKGDPTLMFTNAGMNQFKDYFLGNEMPKTGRMADTQKCLRVSGKHNDLEEVGHDLYHHTMFEMLGNWAFGNALEGEKGYFKEEAIAWAWELLTEVYKLDKNRLFVTVFEGDEKEKIPFDQEAFDCWSKWIEPSRILKGNKKDNFWEMGDTGPCGPCTEIHYDGRTEVDRKVISGADLVNNDHPDVIEIWNNVFIEFNRKSDGSLEKLPAKHVDTGMGFERLVRVLQNKNSNYDTDVFQYIIRNTEKFTTQTYGVSLESDIAFRVIADHIRAVSLCIADGQLPSNTGAGYVVRRILRRAVRYGFSYLNIKTPFLNKLVYEVGEYFSDVFPELKIQHEFVAKIIQEEEASFFRTLENGLSILDDFFVSKKALLDGKKAFELYDTFGFPIDLTELICKERNVTVDLEGFKQELAEQKKRSKADAEKETGDWIVLGDWNAEMFCGYDFLQTNTTITRYRTVHTKGKEEYHLVLLNSPFYAESGGQIGDTGHIIGMEDHEKISILNCIKENKVHVLVVNQLPKNPKQSFKAEVNVNRRNKISNNHSATHLLHSALRNKLGNHVAQKGSLVSDTVLRFDFSHFSKIEDKELREIEKQVNEKIAAEIPLEELRSVPLSKAQEMGATALFGEKYGDSVRIIVFDRAYSMELCGGTHVSNTSKIRFFKILSESSVAAGVRRIEAISGDAAIHYLENRSVQLEQIENKLLKPQDIIGSIEKLLIEKNNLQKQIELFESQQLLRVKENLLHKIIDKEGINLIVESIEISNPEAVKNLCFQIQKQVDNLAMVLVYENFGKAGFSIIFSENLIKEKSWNANQLVKDWGKMIEGGGGGQPFFASAGGKNLEGLQTVLAQAKHFFGI